MDDPITADATTPPPDAKPVAAAPQAAPQAVPGVAGPDVAAEPAAPDVPPPSPQAAALDAAINEWLYAHVANSPVSQDTAAWNHLTSKLGELRDIILKGE